MTRHFLKRARQRFDKRFGWIDKDRIIQSIKNGRAYDRGLAKNGCRRYTVGYDGINFRVIYDPHNDALVTCTRVNSRLR